MIKGAGRMPESASPSRNCASVIQPFPTASSRRGFENDTVGIPESNDEQIKAENLIPQYGFMGKDYKFRGRIIIGINPAITTVRTDQDRFMMPKLDRFRNHPTQKNYKRAMRAQEESLRHWPAGNPLVEVFEDAGIELSHIAYFNTNPYQFGGGTSGHLYPNSKAGENRKRVAAERWVGPMLRRLRPRLVVAHGIIVERLVSPVAPRHTRVIVFHWRRSNAGFVELLRQA
jgi:hypothetical protein